MDTNYTVEFRVKAGDIIETVQHIGDVLTCSKRGYKYIYKLPSPQTLQIDHLSSQFLGKLKASSDLLADDSSGSFHYFLQGPTTLTHSLSKTLSAGIGDQIVIRDTFLDTAQGITIEPSEDRSIRPPIPKVLTEGLMFMNKNDEAHPLYGGVFSDPLTWKVTKISGAGNKPVKFSKFTTKVIYAKPKISLMPKNLYKKFSSKGKFTNLTEIREVVKELAKICGFRSIVFLNSLRNCGKRAAVFKTGWKIGYRVLEASMCNLTSLKTFEGFLSAQPDFSILHIRQFAEGVTSMTANQMEIVYKVRDVLSEYLQSSNPSCLVLSSSTSSQLPGPLRNITLEVTLPPPGAQTRSFIFQTFFSGPFSSQVIQNSAGKSIEDLLALCSFSKTEAELLLSLKSSSTGIPNVKWEDVGGLQTAKQEIIDTIQLPLTHPEYFKLRPRSGLLLYGPPGTGKTLLAKAIATECSLHFLPVKGPELLNMYIGESEKNVRELFDKARALQPCVLFFDELDSLAPKRGQGSDLGVMDRIVSQLLTEIDSLQLYSKLFIIGATNRPDLLDSALLRPGRFDKMIYLGIPDDFDSKLKVFEAQTHKFCLEGVNLEEVAKKCVGCYSGADIYAICSQALAEAYKEKVRVLEEELKEVNENEYYNEEVGFEEFVMREEGRKKVAVRQEHFERAVLMVKPTISEKDLEKYKFFGK